MDDIPIQDLRRFISSCDPQKPLTSPSDSRYVELGAGVRGSSRSCVEELRRVIMFQEETSPSTQLFMGFSGSGKTTELHRLKHMLENDPDEPCCVVLLNALDYIDRYTPPNITDLLRVLAYVMESEALRWEGADPDANPTYPERLWRWLQSDVELKQIGFDAYGQKLMLELRNNTTFRERAQQQLNLRFQAFASEARGVIDDAILRLRRASGHQRVVLLVDSLEKFTGLTPDDQDEIEACVERMFTSHAQWLKQACHTVYTCPLWMRFRSVDLGRIFDAPVQTLPMIKIRNRDGSIHEPGFDKMLSMVVRRLQLPRHKTDDEGAAQIFGDYQTTLRPMIAASGGYPRDLIRMVRDSVQRADGFPVSNAFLEDQVIDVLAQEYKDVTLRTTRNDRAVMRHIAHTHELPQGPDALSSAGQLFGQWLALTYRNGREWYDLHPLVQRHLNLDPEPPDSAAHDA